MHSFVLGGGGSILPVSENALVTNMSLGLRVDGDVSNLFGDVGHLWVFSVASLTFFWF